MGYIEPFSYKTTVFTVKYKKSKHYLTETTVYKILFRHQKYTEATANANWKNGCDCKGCSDVKFIPFKKLYKRILEDRKRDLNK